MNRLKNVIKEHALNEDAMLTRIRSNQHVIHKKEKFMPMKRLIPLGLAAALVIAVIASWSLFVPGTTAPVTTGTADEKPAVSAYAMVAIDINPSFEIYSDTEGNVLKIKAKNDDAEQMDVSDYIGGPVDDAIDGIVAWADEHGYLTSEPTEKDGAKPDKYALVTTVILDADKDGKLDDPNEDLQDSDEAKQEQDAFGQKIQIAVQEALDELAMDDPDQNLVRVAMIKATLREKFDSEGKDIPLGLYIIHGMVDKIGDGVLDDDEKLMKVSDLLKSDEEVAALAKRATILERKADKKATQESLKSEKSETGETESTKGKPVDSPSSTAPGQSKNTEAVLEVSE